MTPIETAFQCVNLLADLYNDKRHEFFHIYHEETNFGINMGLYQNTVTGYVIWVFRGSVTPEDWVRDMISFLPSRQNNEVFPLGFAEGMEKFLQKIDKDMCYPDVITGHSLGAAHAVIAYHILSAQGVFSESPEKRSPDLITFGCPNTVLETWVGIQSIFQNYKNGEDYVTTLPPWPWTQYHPETILRGGHDTVPSLFMYHHIQYYQKGIQKLL